MTETSGHDRTGWPVVTGVTVPATSDVKALVLVAETGPHAGKRLPLQVLASLDAKYPAGAPAENRPSKQREIRLVEVCFLADLPAGETVTFRLYHDGPATRAEESERLETIATRDAITYSDDRLAGNTIDTGPARFTLHGPSGQLLSYAPKFTGFDGALTFLQGPIHWNPDVYVPPMRWGHASDWGNPDAPPDTKPTVLRASGPLACRVVRFGKMPWTGGVETSVTYTFFAGQPFVLESSVMRFTADTRVAAVRTNELVFSRGQHTHAAWAERDEDGKPTEHNEDDEGADTEPKDETEAPAGVRTRRLFDPADPKHFFGYKAGISPDVPWIGLFNAEHGYGIAAVNQSRVAHSPQSLAGLQDDLAHYYVLDYGDHGTEPGNFELNFAYFGRLDVQGPTVVPAGAIFAERTAFLVIDAGKNGERLGEMERWAKLLREPPRVTVER